MTHHGVLGFEPRTSLSGALSLGVVNTAVPTAPG